MGIKKMLIIVIIIITFGQSCLSTVLNDWICVPGQRVGPITKEINDQALIQFFGIKNIKTETINSDEELGTPGEIITYVYPNTKNEIMIRWKKQKPWIISIYQKGTQWKMAEGITVGSSLKEVLKINKKDFFIAGYGWEYGGRVISWNDGELAKYKGKLEIFFDEGNGTLKGKEFIGDKKRIKTDNMQLLNSKPKVRSIDIIF